MRHLLGIIVVLVLCSAAAAQIAPPTVGCTNVRVFNKDTGEEYYTKGTLSDERRGFSLAKMMTAHILLREKPTLGDLSEVVTIEAGDLVGGSGNNLLEDDELTLHSLLLNMLMESSNTSANAIARVIGDELTASGGVARFVTEMNTVAASLDMDDTTFEDPHGNSDQESSCEDLATIFSVAANEDLVREAWFWRRYRIPVTRGTPTTILLDVGSTIAFEVGVVGRKSGSNASDSWSQAVLWEAPNGQEIVFCCLGGTVSAAAIQDDVRAMITQLPIDFPELATPSTPWTPATMFAALSCGGTWIDFTDETTMFSDEAGTTLASIDGTVARVNDKSGNGNNLTQSTSGSRPTMRNSGSDYWIDFDGTNDMLTFGVGRLDDTGLFCDSNEEFMLFTQSETAADPGVGGIICRGSGLAPDRALHIFHQANATDTPELNVRGGATETSWGLNDTTRVDINVMWNGAKIGVQGHTLGPSENITMGTAVEPVSELITVGSRTTSAGMFNGNMYQIIITDVWDQDQFRRCRDWLRGADVNAAHWESPALVTTPTQIIIIE